MFYVFKNEFKKILWFILGLICGFLINNFNPFSILLDEVSAIGPTNWYNAKQMHLYSSLIVNSSNTTIDNGTNVVSDGIPMLNFNKITASGLDLLFAPTLVVEDYSYQLDIYSCGMSRLSNNLRTGAQNTNMSLASNINHDIAWVSNPTTSYSGPSSCKIDTFVFTSKQTGVYFKIGIENNSTFSNFRILGYNIVNVSKSSGGASSQDIINSQNTIINSINSNAVSNNNQIISNNNSNFSNVNSNLSALNSNLTDDIVGPTVGDDLFDDDVYDEQFDLISIANIPFDFLSNMVSGSTCSPLVLPLNTGGNTTNITIPCMQPILRTHVGSILTLYQVFISGILIYSCIMTIIHTVIKSLNPNIMKIDVIDL